MKPEEFSILTNQKTDYEKIEPCTCDSKSSRKNSILRRKELPIFVLFAFLFFLQPLFTQACDLKFSISGEQKESYKAGEELIVEVTVVYTHRTCEIQLSDTKFTYEGMKILGATAWKEKAPNTFSRQIKISLSADSLPEARLTIVRKCSKDGAIGSFKISKTS